MVWITSFVILLKIIVCLVLFWVFFFSLSLLSRMIFFFVSCIKKQKFFIFYSVQTKHAIIIWRERPTWNCSSQPLTSKCDFFFSHDIWVLDKSRGHGNEWMEERMEKKWLSYQCVHQTGCRTLLEDDDYVIPLIIVCLFIYVWVVWVKFLNQTLCIKRSFRHFISCTNKVALINWPVTVSYVPPAPTAVEDSRTRFAFHRSDSKMFVVGSLL